MFVWEIQEEGCFGHGSIFLYEQVMKGSYDNEPERFYLSRETAEAWMQPFVKVFHKIHVAEMRDLLDNPAEAECFSDEAIEWWRGDPPITVERTEDQTWWGVGPGDTDSRDRCGAAYAWLIRRHVVDGK